ncbi:nuclear transport factor 2 family protein [Arthrobacter sp. I2-34]|uniref:Nuclear transport factor 2 family protein n=1 Tax=Arthrobacter hankyongi TaxID=2904801 RepID=A0ABS9L8Q0_9MICC|nr:nuclear transport factor 2 family protein [Arthrobacter hankyongi]MCG2623049.1 nuclear transport factor 2 family protein [Arthrobacter hankyongi]
MAFGAGINTETRTSIEDLVGEFNWRLDHGIPEGFASLFTRDGSFTAAGKTHQGTEQLQCFADNRTAQDKVSRTILGIHRLQLVSADEITGRLDYILFMGPQEGPKPADPAAVGEYIDTYRREDGVWRIAARESRQVFARPKA